MKRSPLKRTKPLRARKPMKKVNPKRKARLSEEQYGTKEFREWIHAQPCVVVAAPKQEDDGPIEQVHVISRGAGGKWNHTVPMRRRLHRELHQIGMRSFETKYHANLAGWAAYINGAWHSERFRRVMEVVSTHKCDETCR